MKQRLAAKVLAVKWWLELRMEKRKAVSALGLPQMSLRTVHLMSPLLA
jgi:hypothetical protein